MVVVGGVCVCVIQGFRVNQGVVWETIERNAERRRAMARFEEEKRRRERGQLGTTREGLGARGSGPARSHPRFGGRDGTASPRGPRAPLPGGLLVGWGLGRLGRVVSRWGESRASRKSGRRWVSGEDGRSVPHASRVCAGRASQFSTPEKEARQSGLVLTRTR